jgi:hypothetical protein
MAVKEMGAGVVHVAGPFFIAEFQRTLNWCGSRPTTSIAPTGAGSIYCGEHAGYCVCLQELKAPDEKLSAATIGAAGYGRDLAWAAELERRCDSFQSGPRIRDLQSQAQRHRPTAGTAHSRSRSREVQSCHPACGTDPPDRGVAMCDAPEFPFTICRAVPTTAPILPRSAGTIMVVPCLARLPHLSMKSLASCICRASMPPSTTAAVAMARIASAVAEATRLGRVVN